MKFRKTILIRVNVPKLVISDTIKELTSSISALPERRRGLFLETLNSITSVAKASLNRKPLPEPVRVLAKRELKSVLLIGKRHAWNRRNAIDTRNAFQWIRDYYGPFVPGLLQGQLREADFYLWSSFRTLVARHGLPPWLDIPTAKENDDRTAAFNELAQDARELSKALSTHASRVRRRMTLDL